MLVSDPVPGFVLQRHPATSMMGCLPLAFSNCLSLSHACTHKVMRGNEAGRKWVKMIKYGRQSTFGKAALHVKYHGEVGKTGDGFKSASL